MTTRTVAAIRSVALLKRVMRWMPTFLGFPAGGLAAKLIIAGSHPPVAR